MKLATALKNVPEVGEEGAVALVRPQRPFSPQSVVAADEGQNDGSVVSEGARAFDDQV